VGNFNPSSTGAMRGFELEAFALAKEGSGEMTMVEFTRLFKSTTVALPHLVQRNCTFE
jgi:hypothetical protein